jgi:hypothetical protein
LREESRAVLASVAFAQALLPKAAAVSRQATDSSIQGPDAAGQREEASADGRGHQRYHLLTLLKKINIFLSFRHSIGLLQKPSSSGEKQWRYEM